MQLPDDRTTGSGVALSLFGADTPPLPAELAVELTGPLTVASGHDVTSILEVRNDGPGSVALDTNGRVTFAVVDPTTGSVVGGSPGAQTMALVRFAVPAGGQADVPLLAGTASLDPALGYRVPAGAWEMVATITVRFGGGDAHHFRTPPLPLTVVPGGSDAVPSRQAAGR